MKREHNEDSWLINEDLGLFVVCDGMGGHAGGETASRLAVQTIERELLGARMRPDDPFTSKAPLADAPLAGALREAIEGACAAVYRTSKANPELQGMGTTCIALLIQAEVAILGHVGDSRAYAVRDGEVVQLTEDHSLVNEQIKAGMITPEEAKHSRYKNIITRSVGFEEEVQVDVMGLVTEPGDTFILCSDGLANMMEDKELLDITRRMKHEELPKTFVELANERGGDDNITVIVVQART